MKAHSWIMLSALVGLLLLGSALLLQPVPVGAQDLPPRPTALPPTAEPAERSERGAPGRITGTVIDLRTGAPAPGITVLVGELAVASDSNGNYDRNGLVAGSYRVALALGAGSGEAAQGPIELRLESGQTVVQHLAFRSPAPAPLPTVAPLEPSSPPPVAALPAMLPATGGHGSPAPAAMLLGLALLVAGLGVRRRGR